MTPLRQRMVEDMKIRHFSPEWPLPRPSSQGAAVSVTPGRFNKLTAVEFRTAESRQLDGRDRAHHV